jgi:site-specific DNA-cytosine methylase
MSTTNSEGGKALRLFAHGDISVFKEQDATNTLLANDTNKNFVTEEHADIAFSHTQGLDPQASTTAFPTLRANGSGQSIYTSNRRTGGVDEHSEISPTLLAFMGTGGGNVPLKTETLVRRLTPKECERLQGFPDNWTNANSDTHRYRQMGNAVAVPVVQWIIEGIVETHREGE